MKRNAHLDYLGFHLLLFPYLFLSFFLSWHKCAVANLLFGCVYEKIKCQLVTNDGFLNVPNGSRLRDAIRIYVADGTKSLRWTLVILFSGVVTKFKKKKRKRKKTIPALSSARTLLDFPLRSIGHENGLLPTIFLLIS